MGLGGRTCERQSEPKTLAFRSGKRGQGAFQDNRIEAGAVVTNRHDYATQLRRIGLDEDAAIRTAAPFYRFRRVTDQVDQGLLNLQPIAHHQRQIARKSRLERDVIGLHLEAAVRDGLADQLRRRLGNHLVVAELNEVAETAHNLRRPVHLGHRVARGLTGRLVVGGCFSTAILVRRV